MQHRQGSVARLARLKHEALGVTAGLALKEGRWTSWRFTGSFGSLAIA